MRRMIGLFIIVSAASAGYSQPNPTPTTVAERAALYERIAGIKSTAELERLAREAAASTDPAQVSQLQLILERYFELDAAEAVKLAGELQRSRSPSFVGSLYERLARSDINEALSALSQVDDLAEARAASLAVFRGLGADERAFDLVAASLQGGAKEQFRGDAIAQLAVTAPQRALDEALALADPEKRRSLAMMIVARWANDAGSEAIAAADQVADPELRSTLWTTVLRQWRDTGTLLTYVATLDPQVRGKALMNSGLERLAAGDASRAGAIVATLPEGVERTQALWVLSGVYARQDPDAAVAWARTLDPPAPEVVANVIRFVASREPVRAFDLAASLAEPQRSQMYLSIVNAATDGAQLPALASRVVRIEDGDTKARLITTLVEVWANRRGDPEGALAWLNANETAAPPEAFERVGYSYARSNPTGAASSVDGVPNRVRAVWIAAVAFGIATTDVQGATQFLERFRGEPGFDRGAPQLATQVAETDPAAAARLFASVGMRGADGIGPAIAIARSWAQRDPKAAAAWALDLAPMQRRIALQMVTGIWGSQDPAAVRQWALGMPSGDQRDEALAAAMRARGAAPPDAALLAAFSQDRARQTAMMNTIVATAQTDAAAARRLIGEHITDPTMRARAEEMLDSLARGMVPLPAGGFGVPAGPAGGVPFGVAPSGVTGPAVTVIGPNGQPITVRRPIMGTSPEPGPIALPPGAVLGPIPAIPPAVELLRSDAPPQPEIRR